MSFLEYITDDLLIKEVKSVLDVARKRKSEADKKFNENVIDPFGALFESTGFSVDHEFWKSSELIRQSQKTVQNHVGVFHQSILGHVTGWKNLGTGSGSGVDLVCEKNKIIAEVKNKYNTVTGGKLSDQYYSLEKLVMPKASTYKDYMVYFVTIIPKKPNKFILPFTPSDKEKGTKCPENQNIKIIDGASFFELVTGREFALKELYDVLPSVIEFIYVNYYEQEDYKVTDKELFAEYFSLAYENKLD